jgi:predicted RNA-binding Zn-ribbon protein involved in translation (DUF1610 family)
MSVIRQFASREIRPERQFLATLRAMRVTRVSTDRRCALCERTLLMGERTTRYSPNGGDEFVDVCQLCQDAAHEYGWRKEGAPTTPTIEAERRRSRFTFGGFLGRPAAQAPVASEPMLRRLSESELSIVDAADRFNASQYRRTVGGIAKSLGVPSVSIVALSGVNPDVVVTIAWEISWYQYRVTADSAPVMLAERGHDPSELDTSFREWNAHMEDDGRVVPDIARL